MLSRSVALVLVAITEAFSLGVAPINHLPANALADVQQTKRVVVNPGSTQSPLSASAGSNPKRSDSSDDTAAIESAIAAVPPYQAGTGGGTVELGPGTFEITHPILLRSGVNLVGAGNRATLITASIDGPIFKTANDHTSNALTVYISLRDLFVRNLSTSSSARCLQLSQTASVNIERVCLYSTGGAHAELVAAQTTTFISTTFAGGKGADVCVYLNGGAGQINIARFYSCDFGDANSGILASGGTALTVDGCHFEHLRANKKTGHSGSIAISAWRGGNVSGNYFEANEVEDITFFVPKEPGCGFVIGGNFFTNTKASYFMNLSALKDSTVLSNAFYPGQLNPNATGIFFDESSGVVIQRQHYDRGGGVAVKSGDSARKPKSEQ